MTAAAHEAYVAFHQPQPPGDRRFGLTVGAILLALAAIRWWLGHVGPVTVAFAGCGAALVVLALLVPPVLRPLNRAWMKLGAVMGALVNPVVMLLMFAAVFTPVAMVMRWRGRDALGLRPGPPGRSYWRPRPPAAPTADSLRHQF